nr:hypothetical protein [Tanacetum cinerariifolium]
MADMNIPATNAPAEHPHAIAPPPRMYDQIFSSNNWVPIGKSNYVLDVQKSHQNPILPIAVAILKNTNFFRAFTASSMIPTIYIQQFWNTIDALDITPTNDNNPLWLLLQVIQSLITSTRWDTQVKLLDSTDQDILYCRFCEGHVAKYQQHLDAEHGKATEGGATESSKAIKVNKPKAVKATKPASDPNAKPAPTRPPKAVLEKKQKLVQETSDEPSPTKRSKGGLVRKIRKPMSSLKLVDEPSAEDVPVEEPAYNKEETNLQRALELSLKEHAEQTQGLARLVVQEKGKKKVEQTAHDLLTLQTPKNKSHVDQFIYQRCTPMLVEASEPAESPSLDAELALVDNLKAIDVSHLQNPEQLDKEFTTTAYPNVLENLKLLSEDPVILEEPASSTGTLSSLYNLEKELSFTDQFFVEKKQEEEPGKTNAEAEVQSIVSIPIHQDTSLVPPITTSVIVLMTLQSGSPLLTSSATTSSRIDELEQHMTNLLHYNLALEERLDKHGSRLYKLENLNIPHQVSKAVDEIVNNALDWVMQAPLRVCFSDLPAVDMKEILQQWMFEDKSYKAHEDHKKLYDALEKSLEHDYSDQLLLDLEPPPPPPPAGASGAPAGLYGTQDLSPTDSMIPDDSFPMSSQVNKTKLTQAYLEGQAYEMVKAFYPDMNLVGDQVSVDVYRPPPLGGPPGHVTIQSQFFFNKDLDYLRHGSKGSSPALSISKMKAASYPDFDLELLVLEKICIEDMLSITVKLWTRDLVIRQRVEDFQLVMFSVNNNDRKIMRFNKIYKFSDGTDFGSTGLQSQGIQDQTAQYRYEYAFLDSKGRKKEQRIHRGY